MAYKAPGVYVTDTYVEPTAQATGARFTPAIVGIPKKIYENLDTKETILGSNIPDSGSPVEKQIQLNNILNDFDSISEVKAFLVPMGTLTQKYLNTFTKASTAVDSGKFESYKPEGTLELKSSAIEVNGTTIKLKLLKSNFVSGSPVSTTMYKIFVELKANVNVEAAKSTIATTYEFNSTDGSLTITLNEPRLKLPSADDKITVSVKLQGVADPVNIDITDPANVIDQTKGVIVAQSNSLKNKSTSDIQQVTVSYKIVNPVFQGLKICKTESEIESVAGPIHPLNTFAYTASLALATVQGTAGVALVAVPSSDATVVSTALSYIDTDDSIYAVAFALNAKTGTWLERVNEWLDQYEKSMSTGVPRIAFVGFESFADYGDTISPANATANMTSFAFRYEQKRLRILANAMYVTDYVPKDLSGSAELSFPIKVPGYTWGGVYAGTVCYYMNNDRPDYSFTLKPAANVSKLYFPNGHEQWFTQDQLNELSASGLWVLSRRPGTQTVVTRHAVTTAETKSSTFDDSIVRIVDYVMLDLRAALNNMIGNVRLDEHSIRLNIIPVINERLKKYQAAGLISADSKLNFAQVDPTNKNVLNISITLKVAGSADVIQVAFVVM
jgi:hypothetical protein